MSYLFVHFKEKFTPDGEQVYFALSRDGLSWEAVHGGQPVLWAFYGDYGVRDMTIVRDHLTGRFHIFATDLSLSLGMRGKYHRSWDEISRNGSKCLAHWQSDDLVHWSEEELISLGDEHFGCLWAPDILYDRQREAYLLHFSCAHDENGFGNKKIWYSLTKDFITYSKPEILYAKQDSSVIDSAIYEENGLYYMFIKSDHNPSMVILEKSASLQGPWERVEAFDRSMSGLATGQYEAPTAVRLKDGRWSLYLDFYGTKGRMQGYVPFIAPSLSSGEFVRSDEAFHFPYHFKHGTILEITDEEYDRIAAQDWSVFEC
ncbi:MAG: glycoside hydrolase family 43 protein [Clostridia bacterium]|nr:glycoside hydrolase family 43 protein [Clostridia bacterium]